MISGWKEYNHIKEPIFEPKLDYNIVTFYYPEGEKKTVDSNANSKIDNVLRGKYGQRVLELLVLIDKDSFVTKDKLVDKLNVSLSTIEKDIKKLKDEDIVRRNGSWEIIKSD